MKGLRRGSLLLVIAMSAITGPALASARASPVTRTLAQLAHVQRMIELFRQDCGTLPPALDHLLTADERFAHCWNGPYARPKTLVDLWGNRLVYRLNDSGGFVLYSKGRDDIDGSADDIDRADPERAFWKEYPRRWSIDDVDSLGGMMVVFVAGGLAIAGLIESLRYLLVRHRAAARAGTRAASSSANPP